MNRINKVNRKQPVKAVRSRTNGSKVKAGSRKSDAVGSRKGKQPKKKPDEKDRQFIDLVVGGEPGDEVVINLPNWKCKPKRGMIRMPNGGVLSPSKKDMAMFAEAAKIASPPPAECPFNGAVVMTTTYTFKIPDAVPDGMAALPNAGDYMIGKPDLDNLTKLIGDAMTGIYYDDDCLLAKSTTKKVWGVEDGCCIRLVRR
jgi:Holliday junction resolvase RusA-like endonuclease